MKQFRTKVEAVFRKTFKDEVLPDDDELKRRLKIALSKLMSDLNDPTVHDYTQENFLLDYTGEEKVLAWAICECLGKPYLPK